MEKKRVAFVHTSTLVTPMFSALMQGNLPGVDFFHIADDSLIRDVIEAGGVTPNIASRLLDYIRLAVAGGADIVVVTCSSVGEVVEWSERFVPASVIRIDKPMAEYVVRVWSRIGVVATLKTTLEPTVELIKRCAAKVGKNVEVGVKLCDGAFDRLLKGEVSIHDQIIRNNVLELAKEYDVVVLAQASMARALESLDPNALKVPICTSPPLLIDYLRSILQK